MDNHNSSCEAQLLIDNEIAALTARMQESIRLLKTRRNELAPVSKLPDEILLQIFVVLRDSTDLRPVKWLQIMHVCQYWRHIAVGSSPLWTRLHDPPPSLTRLQLECSQNAPLDVVLTSTWFKHAASTEIFPVILHEIERIRTLNSARMPPSFLDAAHDILTGLGQNWEARSLETLTIGTDVIAGPRPTSIKLVTDVFRPTRRLRRLTLSSGYYSWDMFPIPGLTHLCLDGISFGEVTGAQFLETLRHMQNLEALMMMNWENMKICQFPPTPRPQPIQLPSLRRLEIWCGNENDLELFLTLLVHPKLHQWAVNPSWYPVTNVPACMKSALSPIEKANFGLLEFMVIHEQKVIISAMPEIYNPRDDNKSSSGIFLHIEDEEDDLGTPFKFIVDLMSSLALLDRQDSILLRHIHLDSPNAPIAEFTRVFAYLPHLETIQVYNELAPVLFKSLNLISSSDRAIASTHIPFPKLRLIIWHGKHRGRRPVPTLSAAVFDDLHRGLLLRHAHGVFVTMLMLVNCERLNDTQVHQLKEIGVQIMVKRGGVDLDILTN
ncbi:hypothetical protein D9619_010023 [Psilocybe cf. subviscida]|uniref:F-box domain-containing protein n=1 Tax=Psilocybe cf. subviscida TaxID=2480587 RepID=A0A8H5BL06_9AGAR|nr:hypothetical protein D9619_010023 [Psilocybe cf. subviscida]